MSQASKESFTYLTEFSHKYFKLSLFNVYNNPIPLLPMQQGDRVVVTHRVVVSYHIIHFEVLLVGQLGIVIALGCPVTNC